MTFWGKCRDIFQPSLHFLLAPASEGEHHRAADGAAAADSKDTADEKMDGKLNGHLYSQ